MFLHRFIFFFQCVFPFGSAVVESFLCKTSATEVTPQKQIGRKSEPKSTERHSTTQVRIGLQYK
jgi:hypothetical protein